MIRSHHTNQPLLLAFHWHDLSIHPSMCFLSGTPQGQQSDKHINPPRFPMCPIQSHPIPALSNQTAPWPLVPTECVSVSHAE